MYLMGETRDRKILSQVSMTHVQVFLYELSFLSEFLVRVSSALDTERVNTGHYTVNFIAGLNIIQPNNFAISHFTRLNVQEQ